MQILLGVLAGIVLPIQTSINTKLRERVGKPHYASLVSFTVSFLLLTGLLFITGQGINLPLDKLANEPLWVWSGGICSVFFLTGNILLLSKLNSVETVMFPVLGQILMGLVIDHYGLFYSPHQELTVLRSIGAVFVILGVVIVSLAKTTDKIGAGGNVQWLWRITGIITGMLSAIQTAVNGHLGTVLKKPILAAAISFGVGMVVLMIVSIITLLARKENPVPHEKRDIYPWWIWIGGILGGIYILVNVYLSGTLGTGITIIVLLIGSTCGGLLIDHFGLFGTERKKINVMKVIGVGLMIFGAATIKLF